MGSSKPKAKIDKFFMSAHYGVCLEADEVKQIQIKEKRVWQGRLLDNTTLNINNENLFGGILKEGGVSGRIDVMFGGPTQKVSAWLASKFGRTVDTSPGYRGILSLVFRGATANRGFYWTASQPYLGAIWVTLARFPKALNPTISRVPRVGYNGPMSVFFVLDDSGSMAGTRLASMKEAVNLVLDQLPYHHRIDLGGATMNGRQLSFRNATAAQVEQFRQWVNDTPASGGTNFLTGMQPGVSWFNQTANDSALGRRLMFFITDGEPSSGSDDQAAAAAANLINRTIPVDIYAINIELANVNAIAKLDNTPEDGLPVVSGQTSDELAATLEAALAGAYDANPAHIIYECATNPDWGLGWTSDSVDMESFLTAAQTLYNERFGLSLMWTQSTTVENFANEVLDCIKGSTFTNPRTGKLTLRLIRGDYDVDQLPILNPDNAKLRNFARKAWGETTNEMKVTWTNPDTEGGETVYAQDLGNIAMQGEVISDSKNFHGVRRADLAQRLANRELRQASAPLCSCEATIDRTMWDITPFDCVLLTWPEYGVYDLVMRVVDINYGATGSSAIRLSLIEDIFSLPEVTFVEPPSGEWINPDVPPGDITHGRVMPVPPYMAAQGGYSPGDLVYPDTLAALLVAAPEGSTSSDFTFEVEEPTPSGGLEWVQVGEPRSFLGTALLATAVPREEFTQVRLGSEVGQWAEVNSFLLIGPVDAPPEALEMALVTGVDEETGTLTLMRGVLDTVPAAWPAGTPVWVGTMDDYEPVPANLVAGQTFRVRVLGQSSGGQTSEPVVFSGVVNSRPSRPARPADVKVNGVGFNDVGILAGASLTFTWAHRNRLLEDVSVLSWTAASVPLEEDVTYKIESDAIDINGALIEENWLSVDVGVVDTHTLDLSDLDVPAGSSQLRFRVVAVRDAEDSWQNFNMLVDLVSAPSGLTAEYVDVFAPTGLNVEPLE